MLPTITSGLKELLFTFTVSFFVLGCFAGYSVAHIAQKDEIKRMEQRHNAIREQLLSSHCVTFGEFQ